mmetsp:Transcript_80541/g.204713  ORF Transcript_80541/g.204713 Transcript_80541/m.204713 type:complete len:359 (+) Transcript_80541:35-1111(+)
MFLRSMMGVMAVASCFAASVLLCVVVRAVNVTSVLSIRTASRTHAAGAVTSNSSVGTVSGQTALVLSELVISSLSQSMDAVGAVPSNATRYDGTVCFFVRTSTVDEHSDGRAKARAVAETWALAPAERSRVYFFVDEDTEPYHLPSAIPADRIIKTVNVDYNHLPQRMRVELVLINSREFKESCDWFALVDDDTYVNTASVVKKVGQLDASQLHYMGFVRSCGGDKFVHGPFKLFSYEAVPLIAEVSAKCDDWSSTSWDDVGVARCLKDLGLSLTLPAKSFGNAVEDNDRRHHPKTMELAAQASAKLGGSVSCLDYLHKMLPDDMRQFHRLVQQSPECHQHTASLLGAEVTIDDLYSQ